MTAFGGFLFLVGIVIIIIAIVQLARKKKKRGIRSLISGFVVFIVGIVLAANGSGGSSSQPAASSVPNTSSTSTTDNTSKPATTSTKSTTSTPSSNSSSDSYKIGQTFEIGKFEVRVNSVKTAKSVGDTADGLGDTAHGEYYIVSVSLKNLDKSAATVDSTMFKIKDASGNEYSADTNSTMDLNQDANSDFFLNQLNPGVQQDGNISFDMPTGAKGLRFEVSGGFFSTKTADVSLGK